MMRTTVIVVRAQLVARTRADGRHVYRKEGKAALVAACAEPGASVAALALAQGVNANLLRKWITRSHMRDRPSLNQRTEASAGGNATARSPRIEEHTCRPVPRGRTCTSASRASACHRRAGHDQHTDRRGAHGVVEREAMRRVIDCLRESTAVQSAHR
jgi:transposase-like protein